MIKWGAPPFSRFLREGGDFDLEKYSLRTAGRAGCPISLALFAREVAESLPNESKHRPTLRRFILSASQRTRSPRRLLRRHPLVNPGRQNIQRKRSRA